MGVPLLEAARHAVSDGILPTRSAKQLGGFLELAADLHRRGAEQPVAALLDHLVEKLGSNLRSRIGNVKHDSRILRRRGQRTCVPLGAALRDPISGK